MIETGSARLRLLAGGVLCVALSGCAVGPLDFDLRGEADGFDTSSAAREARTPRPEADVNGVISYPTYQVAVARRGDSVGSIAQRLGLSAGEIADYNGLTADTVLRRGEILALPRRVAAEPASAPVAPATAAPARVDVTELAASAIERAAPAQAVGAPIPATPAASPPPTEPPRHRVARGDTVFAIARRYDVTVADIASWNALGSDLSIREGQFLLIPLPGAARPPSAVTAPGAGTSTPVPPSAASPLPEQAPEPSSPPPEEIARPEPVAAPQPAPPPRQDAPSARYVQPVAGAIIRDYNPGTNEGIDIGAPAGAAVQAADAGTVVAVTQNTDGARLAVIRHGSGLLTVYVNIADVSVSQGSTVSRGQTFARVDEGSPSFLHFEVRDGLQSLDPNDFLP